MTKTEKVVVFLNAKYCMETKKESYQILAKIILNDLYALMGDDWDIEKVDYEKPHMKNVLSDVSYLLSYEVIKSRHAKEILQAAWDTIYYDWDICQYILDKKMFDEISIDSIIEEVIVEQAKAWEEYKSGKDKAIGRLIGSVMSKTKGKADPQQITKAFNERRIS